MDKVKIEKDTDLLEYLEKNSWGTGMIIRDTYTGTEYVIDNISMTMGGQEHLVLELKPVDNDEHWFRTIDQSIMETLKDRESYMKMDKTFENDWPELSKKHPDLIKNCIKQCDYRLEYLEKMAQERVERL